MSHTKMVILHALVAVSALLILSPRVTASWPVKIDNGIAQTLAVDHDGNIIAAGSLSGPTLDVYKLYGRDGSIIWSYRFDFGIASQAVVDLNGDVIVGSYRGTLIKISGINGAELWVKSEFEIVNGVKTDEKGNVFAVGRGNGLFKVVKFDTNGNVTWRYLSRLGTKDDEPSPSYDIGYALDLDRNGDVIAAGVRDEDFAVVKISGQDGVEIGQQEIDGKGSSSYFFEKALAVVVGADGSVLAAGATSPSGNQGPSNFTVAKFSGDLSQLLWINEIDGTAAFIDTANDLTLDAAGDVIAAGVLFNIYEDSMGKVIWSGDQFAVVKLSGSSGEVLWKELADSDHEFPARGIAYSVAVNASGDVFATGLYAEAFTVVKKFSATGKNVWRHIEADTLIHGVGYAITLDAQHAVIAAGNTNATDRSKFTVIKLDPATGLDYADTVPETVVKYAPMVYLHPDDEYRPGNPISFINNSALWWFHAGGCRPDLVAATATVKPERLGRQEGAESPYSNNAILPRTSQDDPCVYSNVTFYADDYTRPYDGSKRSGPENNYWWDNPFYENEGFYLDLSDDPNLRRGMSPPSLDQPGAPVFYEYVPGKYVTYWFFYPYDDFSFPHPLGDVSLQRHEGDWERISIQLDSTDSPLNLFYYSHGDGELAYWETIDRYEGTHPIVYSAKGSHASYLGEGLQQTLCYRGLCAHDSTARGPQWPTWKNLRQVEAQPWYGFGGAWGAVDALNTPVGSVLGEDFTGPLGPSGYKNSLAKWSPVIRGRVIALDGDGLAGVKIKVLDAHGDIVEEVMTCDGSDTATCGVGYYSLRTLVFGRSYTLVPSKEGYSFTPVVQVIRDLRENQTANFKVSDTTPPVLKLPSDITANAVSAQGATVYYNVSATDDATQHPRVACIPLSGALFQIGTTTAVCEAIDDAGNRATGTFKVTVKGAAEQITDLIVSVKGLNFDNGVKNSLIDKLQNALSEAKAGNKAVACNQLRAYINHVQALTGKKISITQSNQMLIAVNRIMVVMGC